MARKIKNYRRSGWLSLFGILFLAGMCILAFGTILAVISAQRSTRTATQAQENTKYRSQPKSLTNSIKLYRPSESKCIISADATLYNTASYTTQYDYSFRLYKDGELYDTSPMRSTSLRGGQNALIVKDWNVDSGSYDARLEIRLPILTELKSKGVEIKGCLPIVPTDSPTSRPDAPDCGQTGKAPCSSTTNTQPNGCKSPEATVIKKCTIIGG